MGSIRTGFQNSWHITWASSKTSLYCNRWRSLPKGIAYQNLNQLNEAQADLQRSMALGRSETIDLTQAKYAIDPADWQNTFNLALYHLAAGDQQEFDMLYCSGLNAPQEMIEMAVRDLEDLREWRIENDELRIGEMIERLKVGRTIGNTIAL